MVGPVHESLGQPGHGADAHAEQRRNDVRDLLERVDVPTLVIHRSGDQWVSAEHGRYLAARIRSAKYIELSGSDHRPSLGDAGRLLDVVETFLTGERRRRRSRADLSARERGVV